MEKNFFSKLKRHLKSDMVAHACIPSRLKGWSRILALLGQLNGLGDLASKQKLKKASGCSSEQKSWAQSQYCKEKEKRHNKTEGCAYSSVVQHLPSMQETLGSTSAMQTQSWSPENKTHLKQHVFFTGDCVSCHTRAITRNTSSGSEGKGYLCRRLVGSQGHIMLTHFRSALQGLQLQGDGSFTQLCLGLLI